MPLIQAVSPLTPAEQPLPAPPDDDTQIEIPSQPKSGGQSSSKSAPLSPVAVKAGSDDPARENNAAFPAGSKPAGKPDRSSPPMANHVDTPGGSHPTDDLGSDELIGQGMTEGRVLFKKYVLKKKLGSGGMGEVWLVHHIELDCDRALKFIRTGLAQSPDMKRRFRREARVMARVSHPNAVEIHDAFTAGGLAFIEMSYVAGKSLVDVLKHGQPMALDWTARILEQLCEVLAVAHEAGIVHRDLKPANLMLLNDRAPGREFLKVLDFGIAKLLGGMEEAEGASLTNNAPIGTYPYMSPEQLGTAPVDQRSDIYTVGIILFEFLTGYRPYSAKNNLYQWVHQHVHQPIPTFQERNPEVELPSAVEEVVRRCLAKSPDDRPHSAQALFEEFAEAAEFIRPPSRSGSSVYSTPAAAPMTRDPEPQPPKPGPAIDLDPNLPEQPKETPGDIKPVLLEPGIAEAESGELSTLSGSYEWESPETFEVPQISVPKKQLIDGKAAEPVNAEPIVAAAVIAAPVEPVRPSGLEEWQNEKPHRPQWLRHWLMAISLLGILGIIGKFAVLPMLGNDSSIKTVPTDPHENKGQLLPPPPVFTLTSSGHTWNDVHYDLYGKVACLPEGYKPKEGTRAAEDGWPEAVVRKADGVEFIRIVGGTYLMGKPIWKPGDDKDSRQRIGDSPKEAEKSVTIKGFYIQKFEVTNKEINDFYSKAENTILVEEFDGWRMTFDLSKIDPVKRGEKERLPAVFLPWKTAERYARSVAGNLPRRDQWEFAASSRGERPNFVWDENLPDKARDLICIKTEGRREVGLSSNDVTKQNVYDMGGNVREWCRYGDDKDA